jgi:acetyl esterase/lipase
MKRRLGRSTTRRHRVALGVCLVVAAGCSATHHAAAPVTTSSSTTMSSVSIPSTTTTAKASTTCVVPGAPFPVSEEAAGPVTVSRNVAYGSAADEVLDIYRPASSKALPAVLLVHGGGWTKGDKRELARIALELAQTGFVAFDANYTLATPSDPGYPNQVDQLEAAVVWIRSHAASYGVDPARVGALGGSAGANLVALLGVAPTGPCTSGGRVAAVVTWSAPMDLTALDAGAAACAAGQSCRINYAGISSFVGCSSPATCPGQYVAASPVSHVGANDPPMHIFNSSDEVIPSDQAEAMASALARSRVPHELTVFHGTKHSSAYSKLSMPATIAFLHRWLG